MKKFVIYACVLAVAAFAVHFLYYKKEVQRIDDMIRAQKSAQIKQLFQNEVENKFGKTFALTYLISQDKKIVQALLNKDNSILDYKETVKKIEQFGEYKNLWIQIIDKEGYSFYRSWTNNVGDHAASARLDIVQMIQDPKPMRGISTGRFDMTFKTMIPIFHEGEFIGMIEMISKFNSIAQTLKSKGIEPLMVLHEDYTKRFIKPFSGLFIKNNYVANLNASKKLMQRVEQAGLERFLYLEGFMIFDEYLVTTDQIKDVNGGEMGFFIFFFEEDKLDKSLLYNFKTQYFGKIIIALVILGLLVLYALNRNYAKELNKQVIKKTKKVKKQKIKLKDLLQIYDSHVIFSKTDTKGVITHASDAFCQISGYSKKELIGKPHNVLRHPDMPKETFSKLWETIQAGKVWTGEIKNLKKNGGHYWVDAEIQPQYNKKKELIGYSAIRHDITDAKEIEQIQKEIIFTMGSIGESRSEETGEHVKRVAEYSKLLALRYGLSEDEAEMIKQASPMHDIGKVAIADSILKKPGKLNDQERDIMNTHASLGYKMLSGSQRPLLKTAAIIAYEHHEKYDGSGYPRGLKGDEIHIYGRITALADVFDALGSKRCYKDAWENEAIFEFIYNEKGKHFDPELVEIFFEHLHEFLAIKEKIKDSYT
jgi:PAS domain S-box-containing protein